jgi:hypothetical protein
MRDERVRDLIDLEGTGFEESFAKRRPVQFSHGLQNHPLLELAAIADLADRLAKHSVVSESAVKPLLVPEGGPARGAEPRPGDLIRDVENSGSWLTLLNVEQDPSYKQLVDACLDRVQPYAERFPGDMRRRSGFIFVSSPNSITPAHFDIEHSLIMQIRGHKTLTYGEFGGRRPREHEVRRYWSGSHGRIESLPTESLSYELEPGMGALIPPITPHWVRNGDAPSVSVTLTFFTRDTDEDTLIQSLNNRLRRLRISPKKPGQSPITDVAKVAAMRLYGLRHRFGLGGEVAPGSH